MSGFGGAWGSGGFGSGAWGSGGSATYDVLLPSITRRGSASSSHIISGSVILPLLPRDTVFGQHVLASPQTLTLPLIPRRSTLYSHFVDIYAGSFQGAGEGPTTGGQEIGIEGPGLSMSTFEDDFLDGVIDPSKWISLPSGSASIDEVDGTMILSSGLAAGSSAEVRGTSLFDNLDFEVEAKLSPVIKTSTGTLCSFFVRIDSLGDYFQLAIEDYKASRAIRATSFLGGKTVLDVTTTINRGPIVSLRLLKHERDIYAYLNGRRLLKTPTSMGAGQIQIGVTADSSLSGRAGMMATILRYTRNPIVIFGDSPMENVLHKRQRLLIGETPPHDQEEDVSVKVDTNISQFTIPTQYSYKWPVDFRRVGKEGSSKVLTAVSDLVIKN